MIFFECKLKGDIQTLLYQIVEIWYSQLVTNCFKVTKEAFKHML